MSSQSRQEILDDAKLILDASIRLGRLEGRELINVIQELEKIADDTDGVNDCIAKVQFLSAEALKRIEGISYFELKENWIIGKGFKTSKISFMITGLLAVFLLFSTSYVMTIYNRAIAARAEVVEIERFPLIDNVLRIMELARVQSVPSSNNADVPNSATGRALLQATSDVSKFLTRTMALETEFGQLNAQIESVFGVLTWPINAGRWVLVQVGVSAPQPSMPVLSSRLPVITDLGDAGRARQLSPSETLPESITNRLQAVVTRPEIRDQINRSMMEYLVRQRELFSVFEITDVSRRLSITFDYHMKLTNSPLQIMQSWILPALFGALGATIFFVRRYLRPDLPNPEWFRVIFRILVGAFAGVIFAWVWVMFSTPPSAGSGTAAPGGGPGPFLLAFLVGYSTDLLFQALDQAVDSISKRISGR